MDSNKILPTSTTSTTTTMPPLESQHSLKSHGSNDSNNGIKNLCVVCDDDSDGLHFGQHTCRACAAFFRRTVSLKLDYTCKHDNNCEIVKTARNMCRSCRYQKCLHKGMLTSAVQHSRDGLGKRKEAVKRHAPESQASTSTPSSSSNTSDYSTDTSNNNMWSPLNQRTSPTTSPSATDLSNYNPNYIYTTNNGIIQGAPVIHTFANMQLSNNYVTVTSPEMKVLQKMVEGYRNFLSLRRASYTLVDVIPRFSTGDPNTIPQSNYGTSKKSCRIEASLVMDVATNYFQPFSLLQSEDKIKLFDTFYCHFSNAERAYNTYKRFGHIEGNDKLIMPDGGFVKLSESDGGFVKLSELSKFYENSAKGDPAQLAQIFGSAMSYAVNNVVPHMTRIHMDEYELCSLFGIFLWRDSVSGLSPEAINLLFQTREEILKDLHLHYRSLGVTEFDITVKIGNLLLLIPKLEHSVKLVRENFNIAELFNMIEMDTCCRHYHENSVKS